MRKRKSDVRIVVGFCLVVTLFFVCVLRIFIINNSDYAEVVQNSSSYKLELSRLRGTIFDCNMHAITNNKTRTIATFLPNESAVSAAASVLVGEQKSSVLDALKKGMPQFAEIQKPIDYYGVYCVENYINTTSELISPQLIGYVDADGHGVSGIQKAYDELLFSEQNHAIAVAIDGLGNILPGGEITEIIDESVINSGIRLTLDSDIQELTLKAMQKVKCGAAVVSEIGTGKIRAMVSVPEFDATKITDYLEHPDSPLVNRALASYNVGSVFKPCVAAAAIEANKAQKIYTCKGLAEFLGHTFRCHSYTGHGKIDLKNALAYSCNVFFYNLATYLGADNVYNMASSLGFNSGYEICSGLSCNANMPSLKALESERSLVNLSIGQGSLLLSPVSILSLYEAIANGGVYYPQTVVEGIVKNGATEHFPAPTPTRVMSKATADTIKQQLSAVLEYGTGKTAAPTLTTAAGKTATAETGWIKDEKKVENSWFCGFFPLDKPKYVVSVLIENSLGGDDIAAPVFSRIADSIVTLENSKK